MSRTRHETFEIADIKLADSHKVISINVRYEEGGTSWFHGGHSERGVYLGGTICEKSGYMTSFSIGGDVHLKDRIADAARYNRKQLEDIANDLKANGEKSILYGAAYKRLIEQMAEQNKVTVATDEAEAFKIPTFMIGEKVRIVHNSDRYEDQDGVIIAAKPSSYDGTTRYDVLLPEQLQMRSMKAAEMGSRIVSKFSQMSNEDIDEVMARYKAKIAENERIQAEAKAADDRAYNAELARLKEAYPFAKREGSEHARAGANCKMELQRAYPGVAFSVTSSTYSGGDSLSVRWTNGPTVDAVKEITNKYEDYDHMDQSDYVHTKDSPEHRAVRAHLGTCRYVNESRNVSKEAEAQVKAALGDSDNAWGNPNSLGRVLDRSTIFGEFQRLETDERGEKVAIFEENTAQPYGFDESPTEGDGVTVTENPAKGGIEIRFSTKPDDDVRFDLKRNGFRWSKFQKIWYAKANDRTRTFAYGLTGVEASGAVDEFDAMVEDGMAALAGVA